MRALEVPEGGRLPNRAFLLGLETTREKLLDSFQEDKGKPMSSSSSMVVSGRVVPERSFDPAMEARTESSRTDKSTTSIRTRPHSPTQLRGLPVPREPADGAKYDHDRQQGNEVNK